MAEFHLEVGQRTDVGRKRTANEDNLGLLVPPHPLLQEPLGPLFVVADGMGGHAKGEVASSMAVNAVIDTYLQSDASTLEDRLVEALHQANTLIWDEASRQADHAGMGTTVVCATVAGDELVVTNAGDSRVYLIRHSYGRQLTRDHSWVGEMVAMGRLSVAEARRHRMRNVITRCLGGRPDLEVPVYPRERLSPGDVLVLCTDGLWGTAGDGEIAAIASQLPAQAAADRLVDLANQRGGPDNITVIVVRVGRAAGDTDDGATLVLPAQDDDRTLTDETLRGVEYDLRQLPNS
jgi:protein phosphatase